MYLNVQRIVLTHKDLRHAQISKKWEDKRLTGWQWLVVYSATPTIPVYLQVTGWSHFRPIWFNVPKLQALSGYFFKKNYQFFRVFSTFTGNATL